MKDYNMLIMITPQDYLRLSDQYNRLLDQMPVGKLFFVGSAEVGRLISESDLRERAGWIPEDEILPFDSVHAVMTKHLECFLDGKELPRGMTGWYYQQFLKMQYARICKDEYYLVWDGDTIPCRTIMMFDPATGKPYLDMKKEFHKEYFDTIQKLFPGMEKTGNLSFIAEHMLISSEIMRQMLDEIEANDKLVGEAFWEKILLSIEPEHLKDTAFSEFETYGTYCHYKHPEAYVSRRWHSFRLGAQFFDPHRMKDRDYVWLGRDFYAISFEKNQSVREDHRNLFDNPEYQKKLTAKQMLLIAQETFSEGYTESWDDEDEETRKVMDAVHRSPEELTVESPLKYLKTDTYLEYEALGDRLRGHNADQAYLCYENAAFLAPDEIESRRLEQKTEMLGQSETIHVKKTAFVILSYNNTYLMQRCLESIYTNCNPKAYSLIVLDNASDDGVAEWLKRQPDNGMILLLSDENMGFAAGCNAATAYAAEEQDIFLLNNDTRMPACALFWLRMALYDSDRNGAVGALQNYSDNGQRLELSFSLPEQYMEYGSRHNVYRDDWLRERCRLSGFAMLIRRRVWDQLHGFDEQFSPGYFEDDDLSFRIRDLGYRLLLCQNSFIYHAGSQSFMKRSDLDKLFAANRQKFIDKWGFDSHTYEKQWEDARRNKDKRLPGIKEIKLIIWDLDETLWSGILSEGAVVPQPERLKLVKEATRRGIINSICSKNDYAEAMKELQSERQDHLWEYFVFPSIDWTSKGSRIKNMLREMSLREENVLFIDDDIRQLKEVNYALPKLHTATPQEADALLAGLKDLPVTDPSYKRLNQYRVLETKRTAEKNYDSNLTFLKDSQIEIRILSDCLPFQDRICELVQRTNQLNFTKRRASEPEVAELLRNPEYETALIRVSDRFGDYGICGFYALNRERKELLHFLFSCRILGMGVEQYLYQKLGFPDLQVMGETAVKLRKETSVFWITELTESETEKMAKEKDKINPEEALYSGELSGRILLKGPCDLVSILPYLSFKDSCELETNFVDDRGIVVAGSNNGLHIRQAYQNPPDLIRKVIADAPFLCEKDFLTFMLEDPYDIVVFSTLSEMHSGIYRHKETGLTICFGSCRFDLTDLDLEEGFIKGALPGHNVPFTHQMLQHFRDCFVFEGCQTAKRAADNISYIRERLDDHTLLVLLLGSEIEAKKNKEEFALHAPLYEKLNRELESRFGHREDTVLLSVTDLISGPESFEDATNHYAKEVYYKMGMKLEKVVLTYYKNRMKDA